MGKRDAVKEGEQAMQVLYRLIARRGPQGIALSMQSPSSEPTGAYTPVRFTRADGIEVWVDITWQTGTLPTPDERADVLARIRRIAERDDRLPNGPDWEGQGREGAAQDGYEG